MPTTSRFLCDIRRTKATFVPTSLRRQNIATHEPPTSDKTSPERGFDPTLPPSRAVNITFVT